MASRATPSPRPPESLRASREHSSRAHRAEGSCHITQVVLIRTGLSSNQRTTVGALAVIDVHARDVMKAMADAGVSESTDFDWQSVTQCLLNFNFGTRASPRYHATVTPSTSEPRPCRDGVGATQVADALLLGGV